MHRLETKEAMRIRTVNLSTSSLDLTKVTADHYLASRFLQSLKFSCLACLEFNSALDNAILIWD